MEREKVLHITSILYLVGGDTSPVVEDITTDGHNKTCAVWTIGISEHMLSTLNW